MEKIRNRIVKQVWGFVNEIQSGTIDESILENHKIPEKAIKVLQNPDHPSHYVVSNMIFRHLMENIGYYDMLPSGQSIDDLSANVVEQRLLNPVPAKNRLMPMPRDFINGVKGCTLLIDELRNTNACILNGSVIPGEHGFSKENRSYAIEVKADVNPLFYHNLTSELISDKVKINGKAYTILPGGCCYRKQKCVESEPKKYIFGLDNFCSDSLSVDTSYYYRYVTPIGPDDTPFVLMHHYRYMMDNTETVGVEVSLGQNDVMRVFVCRTMDASYLIIDSMKPHTVSQMNQKVFPLLVALGMITTTVYLDECWMFAYNDIEHQDYMGMCYRSLAPSSHCKYPIITTNVFQYLVPVGRKIDGEKGADRAIKIIQNLHLSEALQYFPMDVFSRLVEVLTKYESVCRGVFIILSGTDYTLEVQPGVFAVGLEAISNVKNKIIGSDSKNIIDPMRFDALPVKKAVAELLKQSRDNGDINQEEYDAMTKRVDQLNEAFNSDKLRSLLKHYDYPLTPDDDTTIKLRNTLLHGSINIRHKNFSVYGESGALFKTALIYHKLCLSIPLLMAGYHGYIINNAKAYGFDKTCKSFIKIGHWDNLLLNNQTGNSIVDLFDEYYATAFIDICPLLAKFKINVCNADDYNVPDAFKHDAGAEGREPLRNFIQKDGADASTTVASIVIDFKLCEEIGIKGNKMLAAIAHEVGHIIFFFLDGKESYDKEAEEMKADSYVKKVLLEYHSIETLKCLINSGNYPKEMCAQMERRIERLKCRGLFD